MSSGRPSIGVPGMQGGYQNYQPMQQGNVYGQPQVFTQPVQPPYQTTFGSTQQVQPTQDTQSGRAMEKDDKGIPAYLNHRR